MELRTKRGSPVMYKKSAINIERRAISYDSNVEIFLSNTHAMSG